MKSDNKRLASLDILRGLDLFFLLWLQPVLWTIGEVSDNSSFHALLWHFDHEPWEGFRLWDLVMPLFLFMVGTAMPFAFAKYRNGNKIDHHAYLRIGRRFLLLFVFGAIVQGNLLALDPDSIRIYTNTLQAIAVGYLISAILLLHCNLRWQITLTLLLTIIYSLPMALCGDYTPEGNFAFKVDELIIGRFRSDITYTWIWSSLNFAVTVMLGAFAGQICRDGRKNRATRLRAAYIMAGIGVALVALGFALSPITPIIKHIWTSSMTFLSGGYCFILMALFYWWIDVRGHSYGLNWLKIYGMNPITAYVLGEVVNFRSIVHSVSFGLQPMLGEWYAVWLTFGNFLILFAILYLMHRNKVYLKL